MASARSATLAAMIGFGFLATLFWTGFLGYEIFQVVGHFL
jgi:hypothetical protein